MVLVKKKRKRKENSWLATKWVLKGNGPFLKKICQQYIVMLPDYVTLMLPAHASDILALSAISDISISHQAL